MKKKLLAGLVSMCLLVGLLPTSAFAASVENCEDAECAHVAAIGAIHYDTLAEAISDADNCDTVTLLTDVEEILSAPVVEDLTLDLDGHIFTMLNATTVTLSGGQELTIQNGGLISEYIDDGPNQGTNSNFLIETGSSITLENMDVDTTGCFLYPKGDAATVTVRNSEIRCGVYAVSTNAATAENYDVVIELEDSSFISSYGYNVSYPGDSCPVLINVPGTLNMDGCTVVGSRQGVLVRGGTATIKNSSIILDANYEAGKDLYLDGNWGTGDEVPMAALVVGNRHSAYAYPAVCVLENTDITATEGYKTVYAYGMETDGVADSGREVTINYDATSSIGEIVFGGVVTIEDGSTEDGSTEDDSTEDDSTEDSSTEDDSTIIANEGVVSEEDMTAAVEQAAENGSIVAIQSAKSTSVSLPASAMSAAAEKAVDVAVSTPSGAITLPAAVITSLLADTSADVVVAVASQDISEDDEVSALIESGAAVFDVSVQVGDEAIHSFDGQLSITLTVPDLSAIEDPRILHILVDGTKEYYTPSVNDDQLTISGISNLSIFAVIPASEVPDDTTSDDDAYDDDDWTDSSSSGSSDSYDEVYSIVVEDVDNGEIEVDADEAEEGETVTIYVEPDDGYELSWIEVIDKYGDELDVTDEGDGEYTFTMPDCKVYIDASFVEIEDMFEMTFVDVFSSDYYYDAVAWAVEQGITAGTTETTFSPGASCTRAQMVVFLWRTAGSPSTWNTYNPFVDVSADAYYYDAVLWAVEQGITAGTTSTTFSPDATLTRGQTVTFLYRAAGSPSFWGDYSFADVAVDAYYADAVMWAAEEGITAGTSATTFSPDAACTRGQIVTFLYRDMAE